MIAYMQSKREAANKCIKLTAKSAAAYAGRYMRNYFYKNLPERPGLHSAMNLLVRSLLKDYSASINRDNRVTDVP